MISDCLSECVSEIDRYLREFPETYAFMSERITRLRNEMDAVRSILDTPPSEDEIAECKAMRAATDTTDSGRLSTPLARRGEAETETPPRGHTTSCFDADRLTCRRTPAGQE